MAHRTTHRRTLAAAPEPPPNPKPNSSATDPTLQLQLQLQQQQQPQRPRPKAKAKQASSSISGTTIIKTQVSDPSKNKKPSFFMTNHFSRLNLNPKSHLQLQGKAMTVSADFSLKDKARKSIISNPKDLDKKKQHQHHHQQQQQQHVDAADDDDLKKVMKKKAALLSSASLNIGSGIGRGGGGGEGGGRRYSFSGSKVELGDVVASCGVKIISVDMPPFMQIHAVDCARKTHDSLESFTSKTLALTLKKEFDGVYGPAWHCIVGTSFGSFVTHSVGGFLYFSMDQKLHVLLFKTTVQRAD